MAVAYRGAVGDVGWEGLRGEGGKEAGKSVGLEGWALVMDCWVVLEYIGCQCPLDTHVFASQIIFCFHTMNLESFELTSINELSGRCEDLRLLPPPTIDYNQPNSLSKAKQIFQQYGFLVVKYVQIHLGTSCPSCPFVRCFASSMRKCRSSAISTKTTDPSRASVCRAMNHSQTARNTSNALTDPERSLCRYRSRNYLGSCLDRRSATPFRRNI